MAPLIAVWRLLELALILAAAAGIGSVVLRATRWDQLGSSIIGVRPLLVITLGLGALAYSVLAIGLLGGLYTWVIWTWLLFLAGLSLVAGKESFWQEGLRLATNVRGRLGRVSRLYQLLIFVVAVMASLNLIGALAPPLNPDDLLYHFVGPQRYLQSGDIHFIPDKYHTNLPFTMEMLWTAAIGIDAGELAQILNWSVGLLVLCWVVQIGRQVGLGAWGVLLAAVLLYSISTITHLSTSGGVELGATLFVLAAIFALLRWQQDRHLGWLALAAVLAGLYAGTKLPFQLSVGLFGLWVFVVSWRHSDRLRTAAVLTLVFGLVSTGVVGVWYLKNWIMSGNPVYPFLQGTLGGPPLRAEVTGEGVLNVSDQWFYNILHVDNAALRLLTQLYRFVMDPEKLRGHVSPLFVASLPVLVVYAFRASSRMRPILVFSLLLYVVWVPTTFMIRTGLPVLALMSIPVAATLLMIMDQGWLPKFAIAGMLAVWLATSFTGVLRNTASAIPVVAGSQTVDDYILEHGPEDYNFTAYDAYLFINRELPADAKVLLWESRGYYVERPNLYAREFLETLADPTRIYNRRFVVDELRRFGITHVAMNDNHLRRRLRETLEATGRLDCIFEGRSMVVCTLPGA